MLTINGLTKRFGDVVAVNDCSLEIPSGQLVGVIGRSGAGKSTLLRLLNRLIEPTTGAIGHDGRDIGALNGRALRQWRTECAMIFQQFNLAPRLDVLTNVLVGRIGHRPVLPTLFKHFPAEERAIAAAALDRLDMLPQALQRADTLSGGQQQRVAIARALAQAPSIILADEPIASLDPANAQRVLDALRRINHEDGITVICNIHHLDTARQTFERIIGMADGRIVFDGRPGELDDAKAREIYGVSDSLEEWTVDALGRPKAKPPVAVAASDVAPAMI